jgi:hypothetical protein
MEPLTVPFAGNTWREGLRNIARAREARVASRSATRVIAVSKHVRDFVTGRWGIPSDRVGLVYHGTDAPGRITPALPGGPSWPSRFLFTAGSIRPARGLEDAIRAMPLLRSRGEQASLVIAGRADASSRPYERRMRSLVERLGMHDAVIWAGHLNEQQMVWALGLAATQSAGLREMFGSMGKAFHPGRSAQNGYAAALLAQAGFTSGERGIEGPRGFAHVLAATRDLSKITTRLGVDFDLRENTYKPFPCGIVNHPAIDGAIQIQMDGLIHAPRRTATYLALNAIASAGEHVAGVNAAHAQSEFATRFIARRSSSALHKARVLSPRMVGFRGIQPLHELRNARSYTTVSIRWRGCTLQHAH